MIDIQWATNVALRSSNDDAWAFLNVEDKYGRVILFIHRLGKRHYRVAIRDLIACPQYTIGLEHKKITTYVGEDFNKLEDALKSAYALALVMGLKIKIPEQYIDRYYVGDK